MENTANRTYSHPEFEILMSDLENRKCFDCGNSPASWASVNNSIYLCVDCAGVHRGFGVNISYIRSNLIDRWNETQINFLKVGGNKRLRELLYLYEIPKSTPTEVVYNSKLLEYYRNQIKNDVTKGPQLVMPPIEECLQPIESRQKSEGNKANKNYYSVGSNSDMDDYGNKNNSGYFSYFGSILNNAYEKSKGMASTVKDKVIEMDLGNKLVTTGTKTIEVLKDTSSIVKEKGSNAVEVVKYTTTKVVHKGIEVGGIVKDKGTEFAKSDTVKNIKNKVEDGYGYFYGKIFGTNNNQNNNTSNHKEENVDDVFIENAYTKPDLNKDK